MELESHHTPTKLFISHASEDKEDFVEPLVVALESEGFAVWYDKYELTIGDSLLQKIGGGLHECDFGVVVLSPAFFRKKWTQAELDGLFALETTERKVILPIWKDLTVDDVTAFSPMLAGRLGAPTEGGVDSVVAGIRRAVEVAERAASFSNVENTISKFKALDKKIGGTIRAEELSTTREGVAIVADAANKLISGLREQVEELAHSSQSIKIRCDPPVVERLTFSGGYSLRFYLEYRNGCSNSVDSGRLDLLIYQDNGYYGGNSSSKNYLCKKELKPRFHHSGKLIWRELNADQEFTTEQLQARILDEIVDAFRKLHDNEEAKKYR